MSVLSSYIHSVVCKRAASFTYNGPYQTHASKFAISNRNFHLLGNFLSRVSLFGALAISLGVNSVSAAVATPPFLQSDRGLVVIEAEHYHAKKAKKKLKWTSSNKKGFSGDGAMIASAKKNRTINSKYNKKSPRMDYRVVFTEAGTHYVWIRGLGGNNKSNSIHVGINGKMIGTGKNISVPATGSYAWNDGLIAKVNVDDPGVHTLNIWMRESRTIIDKIVLSSDPEFVPTGKGPNESSADDTVSDDPVVDDPVVDDPVVDDPVGYDPDPQSADRYLNVIKRFADIALEYGRDNFGPKRTPLFVDSLSVTEYKPYRWKNRKNSKDQSMYPATQISANFAINGQLHITLRELTKLSGDQRYRDAARDAATYAMDNLVDRGGMFYWGHHETYDALNDMIFGMNSPPTHEMKCMVPAFRYLYKLNPSAVKKNIEQYMSMGIKDWSKLTYTRHLMHGRAYKNPWGNVSRINTNQKVPIQSSTNMKQFPGGLPFITSGIAYYDLTGDERAYKVAYQILKRHIDMRDPKTGLGPDTYAINPFTNKVGGKRYRWIIPTLLKSAELLGVDTDKGKELLKWGIEEATAARNRDTGPTRSWSYALAYRLTENPVMWDTTRKILKDYGLGDIGKPSGEGLNLSFGTFKLQPIESPQARRGNMNAFVIHALVELYKSTGRTDYLDLAEDVADRIMQRLYDNGLFVRQKDGLYGRLGDMAPLAFLHLVAAKRGVELDVDSVFPRDLYIRVRHAGKIADKVWDNEVAYCINKNTNKCN